MYAPIILLISIGLVWLLLNIYATESWLKLVSLILMLVFLGAASYLAFTQVF